MILFKSKTVFQKGFKEVLVTLCDKDLLGEAITPDFVIRESFYLGEQITDLEALKKSVVTASIVNAVGEESVNFLLSNGFVQKSDVALVGGKKVPHAIIVSGDVF